MFRGNRESVYFKMSSSPDLKDGFFFLLLEDLRRHSCPNCRYQQFEYVRHMKSSNVVAINTKCGIRSDAVNNFELVTGTLQDCAIIKFNPPPNKLFVTIIPGDISTIDPIYIGGIYEVCQLPVSRVAFSAARANSLFKDKFIATPGSSFMSEFDNEAFGEIFSMPIRHHNSIVYMSSPGNKNWSMLNFNELSPLNIFLPIVWN